MENIFTHELSRYSTVIVGNGETPQGEIPMLFLQHARFIVCCDGALEKLLKIGMKPDVVIGDCDSVSKERQQQFKDIIIKDQNEEYNDLQKALKYCQSPFSHPCRLDNRYFRSLRLHRDAARRMADRQALQG